VARRGEPLGRRGVPAVEPPHEGVEVGALVIGPRRADTRLELLGREPAFLPRFDLVALLVGTWEERDLVESAGFTRRDSPSVVLRASSSEQLVI